MSSQNESKPVSIKQMLGSMQTRYTVKEIAIGEKMNYAVITTNQNFLILDLAFQDISAIVRRSAYPRVAKLSSCQRFLLAFFSDNFVFLYDTRSGNPISKINGIPRGVSNFVFSYDGSHIFYANSNTLCLWNTAKGELQLTSGQWRNINCYALSNEGYQIALGTYDGTLIVLTVIAQHRVTEMALKKHKSCVMTIALSKNKIFSVSYDRIFLTTTIDSNQKGQKEISYLQLYLQSIPRSIQAIEGLPHLYETKGLFWIVEGNKMRGYADGLYSVGQHKNGFVHVIRYLEGKIEWFIR